MWIDISFRFLLGWILIASFGILWGRRAPRFNEEEQLIFLDYSQDKTLSKHLSLICTAKFRYVFPLKRCFNKVYRIALFLSYFPEVALELQK